MLCSFRRAFEVSELSAMCCNFALNRLQADAALLRADAQRSQSLVSPGGSRL
jgi:hypothetical protein